MNGTLERLRNHMLAATMRDRWETLTEILAALRGKYGMRLARLELIESLYELGKDGTHNLASRVRGGSSLKEFRLYVKPEAIEFGRPRRSGD